MSLLLTSKLKFNQKCFHIYSEMLHFISFIWLISKMLKGSSDTHFAQVDMIL